MTKKQKEEARAAGRPARAGEPSKMVGVRLTDTERDEYEAAAKTKSMSLAEWIRAACSAFLKRRSKS